MAALYQTVIGGVEGGGGGRGPEGKGGEVGGKLCTFPASYQAPLWLCSLYISVKVTSEGKNKK